MIEKKYTLEEITGAWYECYGEYMEDEYEGFIQFLKNKKKEEKIEEDKEWNQTQEESTTKF